MAVTVFYANKDLEDIGVLKGFKLDMSISMDTDENNYEVRTAMGGIELNEDYFIYVENSEYGGIVDTKRINTKDKTLYYSGRTWRGLLESKIIVPASGQDYYTVSGDLNEVLDTLINDFGLDDLFYADETLTGETVSNYQFYRYTDVYSGIIKLFSSLGYKLSIEFDTIEFKCKIGAIPIIDYGEYQEITSDLYDFDISKVRGTVNHLIGLGQGELKDRTVIHKYADANGVISDTQTLFGKDEVVAIYDYGNAESVEDLEESMIEYFQDLIGSDVVKITLNDINADVGDKITAYEEHTGIEAVQYVQSKIITINDDSINTQYSAKTIQISEHGEIRYSQGSSIEVIDNLTSTSSEDALSANMGRSLKGLIDGLDERDYIVEQGTSGIWTYRKWNSGIAECWGTHPATITSWSAWGSIYEGNPNFYETYPTGLFIAQPDFWAFHKGGSNGVLGVESYSNGSATRTPTLYVLRPNSYNGTYQISLYAVGRWKSSGDSPIVGTGLVGSMIIE